MENHESTDPIKGEGNNNCPSIPKPPDTPTGNDAKTETDRRQEGEIQSLKDSLRSAEKWMIWLTGAMAFFALCSVAVGLLQWSTSQGQLAEMRSTVAEMRRSGNGITDQTNTMIGNTNWLARETMNAVAEARRSGITSGQNAKAALDASIAASRIDQRAWMSITPPDAPMRFIDNAPVTGAITMSNVGKTPAFKVLTNVSVQLVSREEKPDFVYKPGHPHHVHYSAVIFPNNPDSHTFTALRYGAQRAEPLILTTETRKLIDSDSMLIIIHGRTTFMDTFRQHHWVTFCIQQSVAYSGAPSLASKTCSDYNQMDGDR